MPIDRIFVDPTLDIYKKMLKECEDKGCDSENCNQMKSILNRINELANNLDDFNEFNGKVIEENLYANFSKYYTLALQGLYQQSNNSTTSDESYLQTTLNAYKDAIKRIEEENKKLSSKAKEQENTLDINSFTENEAKLIIERNQKLIDSIQKVINIGEQDGISYPKFLTLMIENGFDKLLEGSFVVKDLLEDDIIKADILYKNNIEKQIAKEKLELFNSLAKQYNTKVPDALHFQFESEKIDYKYCKDLLVFNEIETRTKDILDDINLWTISYHKNAMFLKEFSSIPKIERKKHIKRNQNLLPGIITEKVRLLKEYFNLTLEDSLQSNTFEWVVKSNNITLSMELVLFLIKEAFPQCKPLSSLNSDSILKREEIYNSNKDSNPELYAITRRQRDYYNHKYGNGSFEAKFSNFNYNCINNDTNEDGTPVSNAKKWDWEEFISNIKLI